MNTQSRLTKLEEAVGINEPCMCRRWDSEWHEVLTSLSQQGANLHQPTAADLKAGKCASCGRATVYDHTFLTPDDRALCDRLRVDDEASEREGRPVGRDWWQAFIGIFDREQAALRAHYGEAYDQGLKKSELPRFRQWIEEQMRAAQ